MRVRTGTVSGARPRCDSTTAAAEACLLPPRWGRVEPGAPADLQVLGCEDPATVTRIEDARLERLYLAGGPCPLPERQQTSDDRTRVPDA